MKTQPVPREPEWTILKLLKWTESYFGSHDIDSPRMTAEIILARALQTKRINLYLEHDKPLSSQELTKFRTLIKRRINREPVAYITGSKEFWSLDFTVTKDVLIPRPDTECLVETVLSLLPDQAPDTRKHIIDLGTGSGAIIISLATERPENFFYATDRSTAAIDLAKLNAVKHGLKNRIHFFCSNWFQAIGKKNRFFDIIISNPPYIPRQLISTLAPEIYRFEPHMALDGDHDGLSDIRTIIHSAHFHLADGGYLLLEIGHDQMHQVSDIVDKCGAYCQQDFIKDYAGHNRVVKLKKNKKPLRIT